jgi:uncharacterized protein YecA (UPF0149 family)
MNPDKQMKKAISKIVGKAYASCVKAERKAARRILKLAGFRAKLWNKSNVTVERGFEKVKRNELCPCESGLRYKKCCLLVLNKREQEVYEDMHARARVTKEIAVAAAEIINNPPDSVILDALGCRISGGYKNDS